jgi:hypothetical protein
MNVPITSRRWRIICDHYNRSQHRKQLRAGTNAPYTVPIPNRSLSDWDDEQETFIVRNVNRVLMRIKRSTLECCDGWNGPTRNPA